MGSVISYMYYKTSVEGPRVPEGDDAVPVQTQTSVVNDHTGGVIKKLDPNA